MKIKNVMVVGAGLMGRGIVEVVAKAGYSVFWYEKNSEVIFSSFIKLEASMVR